jgi:hypothetical protein
MNDRFDRVIRINVGIDGVEPPVWRRIEIPSTCSFWDLHVFLQNAIGWEMGFSVFAFELSHPLGRRRLRVGIDTRREAWSLLGGVPVSRDPGNTGLRDARSSYLRDWVGVQGAVIPYRYGIGSRPWALTLKVEGMSGRRGNVGYPRCLAGSGAAPLEDPVSPGVPVFGLGNPADGEDFIPRRAAPDDPPAFDPNQVVFDDPEDRWRQDFAEPDVLVGGIDGLEGTDRLPDRRYLIPFTPLAWEILTAAGLTADTRIADRVAAQGRDGIVLQLTAAEAENFMDRIAQKQLETGDVRLQRKLDWIHGTLTELPELLAGLDDLYDDPSDESGDEDDL